MLKNSLIDAKIVAPVIQHMSRLSLSVLNSEAKGPVYQLWGIEIYKILKSINSIFEILTKHSSRYDFRRKNRLDETKK